jgi:iron only hydrogenase large subunit-like protein
MQSFHTLYNRLLKAGANHILESEIDKLNTELNFDEHHLNCLLNPEKHSAVVKLGECSCSTDEKVKCSEICYFNALKKDSAGNIIISKEDCIGCGDCIKNCNSNNLSEIKEVIPVFKLLDNDDIPVYALIAPAYISQFSEEVTPGKLRSAFKKLGFAGMIEVALFADILTLKEALEFDKAIKKDNDFLLTSCCCPMWIAMIKKIYSTLIPHMPPSVSPMVASGRAIKKLYPDAKTVFVGPCIAKKAESRDKDITDAVDYVLTFEEMQDILGVVDIKPDELEEDLRDHSSKAGRIYAVTSGVSKAVQNTLKRLKPDREISLKAQHADGVRACKELLKDILEGNIQANFIEGMGCVGGCVGGPKALISKEDATIHVNDYGEMATFITPVDNPYVIDLLKRLGFETIESLLENDNMFIREF